MANVSKFGGKLNKRRIDNFDRWGVDVSKIYQLILTTEPNTLNRTQIQRNKTGIAVFGHFGLSGFEPNFDQLDNFYKQLPINTDERIPARLLW